MLSGLRSIKILLITEANESVASGHLFETGEIARCLVDKGHIVDILVNDDANEGLKERLLVSQRRYYEYEKDVFNGFGQIQDVLIGRQYDVVVTNLREVSNDWINRIKKQFDGKIVCIDEWGQRRLDCDIVINPMIDPFFWDYRGSDARLYAGHEYLALSEKILEYHYREKPIRKQVQRVCISMGGVDKGDSTANILRALLEDYSDITWDVVIGASYGDIDGLISLIGCCDNVSLHQNVSDIYEHFYSADIAFCAGGNTLHELACIGTPSIIIPSVPHERNNGIKYKEKGFGLCLELAESVREDCVREAFDYLQNMDIRMDMSQKGKLITDGKGTERTAKIIESL